MSGLKASVGTLSTEVQRLKKKCEERTEAEEILRQKWKRIEEFDARRLELESVYSSFIGANLVHFISPSFSILSGKPVLACRQQALYH